jgi:hypothetical protein
MHRVQAAREEELAEQLAAIDRASDAVVAEFLEAEIARTPSEEERAQLRAGGVPAFRELYRHLLKESAA